MSELDEFAKKAKAHLDESLDELSPEITRRLQQARYAALEKAKPHSLWQLFPQVAAAVFAISVISISLSFYFNQSEVADTVLAMETEMEMLTSNDNLELMEELEFIQWLVESEEHAG